MNEQEDRRQGYTDFPVPTVGPLGQISGFQFNNGRSWRIFVLGRDNSISATYSDDYGETWAGGMTRVMVPPGVAAERSPLASVAFADQQGGLNSRTFFMTRDWKLAVLCVSSGKIWHETLSNLKEATADSKLGAISWSEGKTPKIRVYYQLKDQKIEEVGWDGSGDYFHSYIFPPPRYATPLAFVNDSPYGQAPYIDGFYQHSTSQTMEIVHPSNGRWQPGNWRGHMPHATVATIDATVLPGTIPGQGLKRVFHTYDSRHIAEHVYQDGKWQKPRVLPSLMTADNCQHVLPISYYLDGDKSKYHCRLFYQGYNGLLHWKRFQDGVWTYGNEHISKGAESQEINL